MAFVKLIAVGVISAVAALEECKDASCAAKAQQLLQKSKTRKALSNSVMANGQHADLQNFDVLKGFVDLMALQDGPLSAEQMDIVKELNKTFYEETLPTIFDRHHNDVTLLKQHADAVASCDTELETTGATVKSLQEASELAAAATADCATTESTMLGTYEQAVAVMTEFLANTHSTCGSIPEPRQPTPEMDAWVMCNLAFYRGFNSSYYTYKAAVLAAESAHSLMSTNCSVLGSTAREKYCSWSDELSLVKLNYEKCREETVLLFHQTLDTANDNKQGRKSDYSALVKIQCYLNILLSQDANGASMHSQCDNSHVDTTSLDIHPPELVPYDSEYVASLGSAESCGEDESPYDESSY